MASFNVSILFKTPPLNELLAEDVVFRSPVAFNPYPGKQVVFLF